MLLGIGAAYVLTVALLAACVLRAKDLAVSDDLRFHEDIEQMQAIRPRVLPDPGGPRFRNLNDRALHR